MRRALLALVLAALAASPAAAANFSIDPISVALDERSSSATVSVTNHSTERVRFQVTPESWSQTLDEPMHLEAGADLIAFPNLFALDPGETRRVRVGTTQKVAGSERAFRLVVEELPSLESVTAPKGPTIAFRARVTIPVFVQPNDVSPSLQIEAATPGRDSVAVVLRNSGTAHTHVGDIHVVARDAAGRTLYDVHGEGWYVLAGAARRFTVKAPAGRCSAVRSLSVDAAGEPGASKTFSALTGACAS